MQFDICIQFCPEQGASNVIAAKWRHNLNLYFCWNNHPQLQKVYRSSEYSYKHSYTVYSYKEAYDIDLKLSGLISNDKGDNPVNFVKLSPILGEL